MDWLDYRCKLEIGFNDEQKLAYLLTIIFNNLERIMDDESFVLESHIYDKFCDLTGTPRVRGFYSTNTYAEVVKTLKGHRNSINEFLSYYVAFLNCMKERKDDYNISYYGYFKRLLEESFAKAHIKVELLEINGVLLVFPMGAKELDDGLVSDVLLWLNDYPKTKKTYGYALKQYQEGVYIRDIADNLRKALESFFQEYLGNKKNLESNKTEVCKYLGENGVDSDLVGIYSQVINTYKNFNDKKAKHNDLVDERLLEFLLYQTGVLIRLAITSAKGNA